MLKAIKSIKQTYSNTQTFALVWSENYTITINNICILKIIKEREWSIGTIYRVMSMPFLFWRIIWIK